MGKETWQRSHVLFTTFRFDVGDFAFPPARDVFVEVVVRLGNVGIWNFSSRLHLEKVILARLQFLIQGTSLQL